VDLRRGVVGREMKKFFFLGWGWGGGVISLLGVELLTSHGGM